MADTNREPTSDDLVHAVTEHSRDEPIVPSATVRWAWWRRDLETGERAEARRRGDPPPGYNGAAFRAADNAACRAERLHKWRRVIGQRGIGWSIPDNDARAEEWAARKGWMRIR